MERYLSTPPDGGYGWVVVTSAFFIMGLTAAVHKNFGLFFLEIQNHYSVLTSTTSWMTSTTIAVFHLGGENFLFIFLSCTEFVRIVSEPLIKLFKLTFHDDTLVSTRPA